MSSVIYLVQLKQDDSYVKKHVNQVRYQPIIEIDKVSIQNETDIIKHQLDKPLSMLPLSGHSALPISESKTQQEPQDINIQNCSHHSKDDISHPIEAYTTREPFNYQLDEGRPKRTCKPPTYLMDYVT